MTKYRTAQGKVIDMAQLSSKNEKVRAVGNMPVNARGDTIDSSGKVIIPVTKKVGRNYEKVVSNRAANLVRRKSDIQSEVETVEPAPVTTTIESDIVVDDLTQEELEMLAADDDEEIEEIKKTDFVIKPASEAPEFFEPETPAKSKKTK